MDKKNILVTGSTGFIGKQLVEYLIKDRNYKIWEIERKEKDFKRKDNYIYVDSFKSKFNIVDELKKIDCIIHLAALAHNNNHEKKEIFEINVKSVEKIIQQALEANVKKFIFLSTVKVYGETSDQVKFDESSKTNPKTFYAKAKLKAEEKLIALLKDKPLKYTIIRSPLVYGYGLKGNLKKLISLIEWNMPIPLVNENNSRSFLAIDNLNHFIHSCINSNKSNNKIYCLSDGNDISLERLIEMVSTVKNKKINTLKINKKFLYYVFKMIGKERTFHSLYSSLKINPNKAIKEMEWEPTLNIESAFKKYF